MSFCRKERSCLLAYQARFGSGAVHASRRQLTRIQRYALRSTGAGWLAGWQIQAKATPQR